MILYSDKIYNKLSPWLSIFERKNAREKQIEKKEYSAILFGCNRIGFDFLGAFKKINENFLVVDHNPEIIEQLNKMGVDAEYGDASDLDFLESLNLSKVQLAISTVSNLETDILIYRTLKAKNPDVTIITVAHRIKDALAQYGEGVDYVILPHFLGSKYAAELVLNFKGNKKKYNNIKQKHLEHLRLRLQIGHEHPDLQNIKY